MPKWRSLGILWAFHDAHFLMKIVERQLIFYNFKGEHASRMPTLSNIGLCQVNTLLCCSINNKIIV